jgi:Fe/S biogenesis protein NfuA
MITFTDGARGKVLELLASEGRQGAGLRFSIIGRMGGVFQYRLAFIKPEEREPGDDVADAGGFQVVVDARSAPYLAGTSVDYVETPSQSGFKIDNPNPLWTEPLALAVQRLIDEEINPALASHGGFVHLLDLKEGVAYVELGGGCQGCGMAHVTLKRGIEARICEALPEVTGVVDTTDHAGGANPYFRASESRESPYA